MAPLDRQYGTAFGVQLKLRVSLLWGPDADEAFVGAAREESFIRVPLDLLDNILMATPFDQRMVWLIDTPKVDEFALTSHCNVFGVLPFYF